MISVLIATRNRGPELETQLRSFEAIERPVGGWELLVINNGSSDETAEILWRIAAEGRLPLHPLSEPRRGKSRALNLGMLAAHGDLFAFTDDDAVVEPQWLRAFEQAAMSHPEAIGFAGRTPALGGPAPKGHGIVNYEHGDADFEIKAFQTPPPGVNFCMRRVAFERYGLFREDLGPGSTVQRGEDTEFIRRLWVGGERLRYVPGALVQHPVHKERLSLGFALRWSFWNGRSNARIAGFPADVPTVARVPRYLYRSMLREAPRAVLSLFSSSVDFPGGHRLAYELGLAYEFRRLPRDFDPGAQVPPWGRADDPREPIAQTRV